MKKVLYFSGDAPILENFHFVNDIFFNLFGFCVWIFWLFHVFGVFFLVNCWAYERLQEKCFFWIDRTAEPGKENEHVLLWDEITILMVSVLFFGTHCRA